MVDHVDDEKTIREEQPEDFSASKEADEEKGFRSRSGSESVRVQEYTEGKVDASGLDEDDFPDGGWRAWLVVAGVCFTSIFSSPLKLTLTL